MVDWAQERASGGEHGRSNLANGAKTWAEQVHDRSRWLTGFSSPSSSGPPSHGDERSSELSLGPGLGLGLQGAII